MAFLTINDLEASARRKAAEIVGVMRVRHAEAFEAAILYGCLGGRQPKPSEPIEFYLLLLDRMRPHRVFSGHASILAEAGAVPFGSSGTFLVPGILQIQVSPRPDFEKAVKALHPQVATIVANHEIVFAARPDIRRTVAGLLAQATQRLTSQHTA
jgi:hypothetical protein